MTLIELVVVLTVVVVLATIAVVHVMGLTRQARETALRSTLYEIRYAIRMFEADCGGHPLRLQDLMRDSPPRRCLSLVRPRLVRIPDDAPWHGPYLVTPDGRLPVDPITGRDSWRYDRRTGQVRSRARGTALDGVPYREF